MADPDHTLGIIAGNRSLPLILAREARRTGITRLVAAGFEGETDPALASLVDELVWLRVGQLDRLIDVFTKRNITRCVMVGQIAPRNLFDLRPDLRAMKLLFRLKQKNAHTIFGAIADELGRDGVTVIEATPWLRPCMPGPGYETGPATNESQREDIELGLRIAKEITRLEIGQTVVVKDGVVLAVEGFEGTDRCLARGGELAGKNGGAVAVKVARTNHDMRFDIPCVGPKTLETCAASGIAVLAFEASRTLLLDQSVLEEQARRRSISLLAAGTPAQS